MGDILGYIVINTHLAGDNIRIIKLSPDNCAMLDYKAGQYITVEMAEYGARSYSIANAPGDDFIEIHVKDAGNDGASTHLVRNITAGDKMKICGPLGEATLCHDDKKPLLMIAGGLGITPVKAVTEDILNRGISRAVFIYWGTQIIEDQYLSDYFKDLAKHNKYVNFVSVTGEPVGEVVARDFDDLSQYNIFIAGPPQMISASISLLLKKGAERSAIYADKSWADLLDKNNAGMK